jgi:hypothetical protein
MKKATDSFSKTLQEFSASFTAQIEQGEKKQRTFATELDEFVAKVLKEQANHISGVDEKFKELSSKLNAEKTEHKSLHDKIESEIKRLRS